MTAGTSSKGPSESKVRDGVLLQGGAPHAQVCWDARSCAGARLGRGAAAWQWALAPACRGYCHVLQPAAGCADLHQDSLFEL
jgi:hypothetical protein